MKNEPYSKDPLLFYPGRRLSDEERRRMDEYDIAIDEISLDQLIYSLSRQIEINFMTFYPRHQNSLLRLVRTHRSGGGNGRGCKQDPQCRGHRQRRRSRARPRPARDGTCL